MQGFASNDIHKTMSVFIKNAKNRQVFVRRQPLSLNRVKATAVIRFLAVIARERSDRGNPLEQKAEYMPRTLLTGIATLTAIRHLTLAR